MKKVYLNVATLVFALFLSQGLWAQAPIAIQVNSPNQFIISGENVGTADFGPLINDLPEPITADVAWAYDDGMYDTDSDGIPDAYPDSLCCSWGTVMDGVAGKIALVRRGACFFSQKVYNAQEAGAVAVIICNHTDNGPDETINMAGADSANAVVIPSLFLSYNNCNTIDVSLQAGENVNVTLKTELFYNAYGPYTYFTPEAHVQSLEHIAVQVVNADTIPAMGVDVTVVIDEPGGSSTTLTNTVDIAAETDTLVGVPGYTPNAGQGEYTMTYTTSLHPGKELTSKFEVTQYMWGTDNGSITGDAGPSDQLFFDSDYLYETGSMVLTGDADPAASVATYMAFGIGNAADVVVGDPESDKISFKLLHADPDGDGVNNLDAGFNDISGNIVSTATYTMTGDEPTDELIYLELDFPVTLTPNSVYYNYFSYDGTLAGTSVSPRFLTSDGVNYANWADVGTVTPLDLDQFYTGWSGSVVFNRLHTEGFVPPNVINTEEALTKDQVSVFPSPATSVINMDIQLEGTTNNAFIRIADAMGKTMMTETIDGMTSGVYNFDVSALAAGNYFLTVYTEEGWRTKHFVKK